MLGHSIVSICTSMASGFRSFAVFRFLLGAAESANWPAATKAVSEWFLKSERGLATALFDSGSSIGGAIAPFVVLGIYFRLGWRPAFIIPGLLGFVWLAAWRRAYHPPESHPRISSAELVMILRDRDDSVAHSHITGLRWTDLLKFRQTWGTIVARSFTDPVWFFVADWFPLYLVSKDVVLKDSIFAIWIPFIAADLGNFFGGAASGFLIRRGWSVGKARKVVVIFGACGMLMLIPTIATNRLFFIVPRPRTAGMHLLRHSSGSIVYARTGGDAKTTEEWLGHSNSRVTMETYVHPLTNQQRTAAAGLQAAIFAQPEPSVSREQMH